MQSLACLLLVFFNAPWAIYALVSLRRHLTDALGSSNEDTAGVFHMRRNHCAVLFRMLAAAMQPSIKETMPWPVVVAGVVARLRLSAPQSWAIWRCSVIGLI